LLGQPLLLHGVGDSGQEMAGHVGVMTGEQLGRLGGAMLESSVVSSDRGGFP